MSITQREKGNTFAALHAGTKAFVIPNPWDIASARALAGVGFVALATSSGASAAVLGKRDGEITRDEALAHARAIVGATDLPVSADLEKGFGDAPDVAAETIRLAAAAGVVGGSIEDLSCAAYFDYLAQIHYRHAIRDSSDDVEIVANQHIGQTKFALQLSQQV